MAQWQRKQAGAIVQAATAHMAGVRDPDALSQIAKIVQFGKAVERTDSTGSYTLTALQAALCTYCKSGKIYPCSGYQPQVGCAFVETVVTLTPSCFGNLT
jgi:hypothetical protein